jgi:hypothetical protein
MPTTINASNTSGGAVVTGDGSGILELQSGGVTGITVNGANVTVAGTLTATGGLAGTLPVANGGTGATTLTGVVKGNGTSAMTAGTVALASEVSGTLPVANGGTGLTSPGTAGNVLTSNGTTWTSAAAPASAMVLLASVVPTAAANVDFLNTFTADYDAYFITLQSILPATAGQTLNMQVAVGGTAQSSASTYRSGSPGINNLAFNATSANLLMGSGTLDSTGNGFTSSVYLYNANGTGWKFGTIDYIYQSPGAATILSNSGVWAYSDNSTLSGVRFLFSGGSNFAAQGRIRVYGFKNT